MSAGSNKQKVPWGKFILSLHEIHLKTVTEVSEKMRLIGVHDEFLTKASQREASRLTNNLVADIKQYAIERSKAATVSPDMIINQFRAMFKMPNNQASSASAATASVPTWWDNLRNEVKAQVLELALSATMGLKGAGFSEEPLKRAAEGVAEAVTGRLMLSVEKYGQIRAQNAKVPLARIFQLVAEIAGIATPIPVVRKKSSKKKTKKMGKQP